MPYSMQKYLNDKKGLFFNHKTGISIDKFVGNQLSAAWPSKLKHCFLENEKLRDFFDILTVSTDKNGQTFISSIEAKEYPIYASQF